MLHGLGPQALPSVQDVLDIDGTTQAGFSKASGPSVTVRGVDIKSNAMTFQTGSAGSKMTSLRLVNFTGYGAEIFGANIVFDGNGAVASRGQ